MAKLTFKCNRLTVALGLAAATILAGTVPAQAQSTSSSSTASQYDQGTAGAANSGSLSQPGSASSAAQQGDTTQQGAMQSSGSSGTSGTGAASSGSADLSNNGAANAARSSDVNSSGASGTTGMSNSQGTSSSSRDMSGGAAVSGTSSTGIVPRSSGSDNATGTSAATGSAQTAGTASYTQANLSSADRSLVTQLARANMAELQLAQLAQSKSTNDEVRNFAQQMIDDHTKVSNELQQLAEAKNVTLPTSLDKKQRAEEQKLNKLSGDQFDRQYLASAGTKDHSKVHSLLEKIGRSAKDQDLRQLATALQPDINKHLQMAQRARRNISGATSAGSSSTSGSTSSGSGNASDSNSGQQQQNNASPSSDQSSGSSTSGGSGMNGMGSSDNSAAPTGTNK